MYLWYFLEGRHFLVLTDHRPPIYALSSRHERYSPRQVRHLDLISQFTINFRHVQGSANQAADALSHLGANALHTKDVSSVVDLRELALVQEDDPDLPRLRADSSLHLEGVPFFSEGISILCDISNGTQRPYVSQHFRHAILTHSTLCHTLISVQQ